MSEMVSLWIGAALGLVGAIIGGALVSIWVEWCRRPRLHISIRDPVDWQFQFSDPQKESVPARTLQLIVGNAPSQGWIIRHTAQRCRALVTFHRANGGSNFFHGKPPVEGRWASTPEPATVVVGTTPNGQPIVYSSGYTLYADIYPGESELLDVVIRYGDETDCYVWNNDTYKYPDAHNPNWKVTGGTYLIKVTVISSGGRESRAFQLMNDGARLNFHLLPDESRRRLGK
jgi:hypothetical protein